MSASILSSFSRRFHRAGRFLGFALGGFFDGILLHQVLQWHHLLSGLSRTDAGDLRMQVVADGLFHAAMYVVAAIGLWMLVRSRDEFGRRTADRRFLGDLLIGFGAWHVLDTLFSHWLTGIHRLRMDVADPLGWEIFWLVAFGLVPLFIGWRLHKPRAREEEGRTTERRGATLRVVAGGAVILAGLLAARAPDGLPGRDLRTVVLRPDVRPGAFIQALAKLPARIVQASADGSVWVLDLDGRVPAFDLYRHGALYVSATVLPAGCSAWWRL